MSIRSLLIAFALALILPTLAFAGFLMWRVAKVEEAQVVDSARETAQQVTRAAERELTAMVASLQALATSPSLQTGDLAAFHAQASDVRRISRTPIGLRDAAGMQLLHTNVPFGRALPPAAAREPDLQAIATRAPWISDVVAGSVSQGPIISIGVPVSRAGEVAYVLHTSVPLGFWPEILRQSVRQPEASVGLIDRNGLFIARLPGHEQFAGKPAGEDLRALEGEEGSMVRINVEGVRVLFTYRRVPATGWLVGVGVPVDVIQAPLRRSLTIVAAAGSLLLVGSLLAAAWFGARIARPIRALSAAARKLGRDEPTLPLSTGLREVNEVGLSLAAASIGLRERSAALRVSEERYRLATEAFQGSVFDFDVASNRSDRTPRHYELLGEGPGAIPSTMEGWHDRIHPDDRPIFFAARDEIYLHGASQYEAEYRVRHQDGSWVWVWHRALALRDEAGRVRRVVGAILDITARREAEDRLKLLVNELNHRVKNTLATVQSIAAHTLRGAASAAEAQVAFEARLLALSRAHNILTRENWEGAPLRSIALEVLEPYRVRWVDRFVLEGPDLWLDPTAAVAVAMGLHELATNAAKYGALTTEVGRVEIRWSVDAAARQATLTWTEKGGPPVAPPQRKGFGSRLIERSLAADLAGGSRLEFRPEGVVCVLTWSLDGHGAAG